MRNREGERERERERERKKERDVEYVFQLSKIVIFIFKRNDGCLGTFYFSSYIRNLFIHLYLKVLQQNDQEPGTVFTILNILLSLRMGTIS